MGVWLPLDDVDERNGCMTFLPGSHLGPVRPHRHIDDDPNVHGLDAEVNDPDDRALLASAVAVRPWVDEGRAAFGARATVPGERRG